MGLNDCSTSVYLTVGPDSNHLQSRYSNVIIGVIGQSMIIIPIAKRISLQDSIISRLFALS